MLTGIKMIAFDMDGTIFSSEQIILPTYQEAIENFINASGLKIRVPTQEQIMLQIGKPVKVIFSNLMPELSVENRDKISDDVLVILSNKVANRGGHIYEGVVDTIQYLKDSGFILVAASNGRRLYIETILKTANVLQHFEDILVLDYQTMKTKGDILDVYKNKYRLRGSEILMVGDRDSDREAATQIGSYFAVCKYGHYVPGEITEWDIELNSIRGLISHVSQ
jgi:phosphoglycolate phosphatase